MEIALTLFAGIALPLLLRLGWDAYTHHTLTVAQRRWLDRED